jgi:hypothetical protein
MEFNVKFSFSDKGYVKSIHSNSQKDASISAPRWKTGQIKSTPPDTRAKFALDISCFPVSIIAKKSRLWSLTASEM